jgi:hypothetical protein
MQQVVNMRSFESLPDYAISPVITTIKTDANPITWMQLLKWGYSMAVAGLLLHLLITLTNFFVKLKRRKLSSLGNVHILRGDKKLPNGSFLNYIFLNDNELSAEEMEQIVAHEMLHVKLYHSADRILMKLVQIILWFNPFVYLYARSMEENHEFEVDREVALSTDKTQYADLLLHLSVANQGMLYHSFSKVPLKKRIVMLFNQPSAKIKRAVYVLVVPLLVISCLAFAKFKKDDIKKIDLVKRGKQLLTAIKTGQDNMIQQLNQPIQIPTDILNNPDGNKAVINQPNVILPVPNDTTRYSIFGNVSKNTKLIIDGKEQSNDLLYEIANSDFSEISINGNGQNGQQTVDIKTKNGKISYLTAHEKNNLRLERTIPRSQFYARLELTKNNGERYDYIKLNLNVVSKGDPMGAMRISPNDKVGFKINGQLYSEDELNTLPTSLLSTINQYGYATYRPDMLHENKYKVIYTLTSYNYQEGQNNIPANNSGSIKSSERFTYDLSDITEKPKTDNPKYKYSVQLGFINKTDTAVYRPSSYKVNVNTSLLDLVNNLPNLTTNGQDAFYRNKKISTLLINAELYKEGTILEGLRSLPADSFSFLFVYNGDASNTNPAQINVISTISRDWRGLIRFPAKK